MITYQEQEDGSFRLDNTTYPVSHRLYQEALRLEGLGKAKIIPFDHDAKAVLEVLAIEQAWVCSELVRADREISKLADGHSRKSSTKRLWRDYRNALRDYIKGDAVQGERPVLGNNDRVKALFLLLLLVGIGCSGMPVMLGEALVGLM